MRQSYLKDIQVTSDGSAILTVSDKPVEVGKVLVVNHLSGNHDNIATTEAVRFRMTNGGMVVNIDCGSPAITGDFVGFPCALVVPEGWYVEGYYVAAANAEIMRLDIIGELYDLDTYRKG